MQKRRGWGSKRGGERGGVECISRGRERGQSFHEELHCMWHLLSGKGNTASLHFVHLFVCSMYWSVGVSGFQQILATVIKTKMLLRQRFQRFKIMSSGKII